MANRFMQAANKRMEEKGTKGSFTRIAKSKGHSVHQEALLDEHKPGKIGKKARMALVFEHAAANRRKG